MLFHVMARSQRGISLKDKDATAKRSKMPVENQFRVKYSPVLGSDRAREGMDRKAAVG